MIDVNWNPEARQLRSFARLWLPGFVAVAGAVIWWRTSSSPAAIAWWAAGGAIALLALASTRAARTVFVGLQIVTWPIAIVVSNVALAIVFFGVVTPIGLVSRWSGRDPLRLRARKHDSHWVPHVQDDDAERAFRQF